MKEIDYYAVLNVRRDATTEEIALAYRKLAIEHHPLNEKSDNDLHKLKQISHLPSLSSSVLWGYINKAYDILSHPLRRQVYDTYGESGLYNGVPLPNGFFQPYVYHGNCLQTYEEVFGSNLPYANIIDAITNPMPLFSTKNGFGNLAQDEPIKKLLYLDLKEIFTGVTKLMKILRYEFVDKDEIKTEIREKTLIVPIAPGTPSGTQITFKQQGDRGVSRIPADVIFITADKPHKIFTRKQSDLHMNYECDLKQALCGFQFTVTTIDDRKLFFLISDVIHTNYVKEIIGEGLPKPHTKGEKGNLYITFNIKFPASIPRNLKTELANILDKINERH